VDVVFQGETVLVTGAAGGIGREIALRFAQGGAHVVLHYRSREAEVSELAERIAAVAGVTPAAVRCDLADDADIERMFDAGSPAGEATMLVNSAGSYPVRPFLELDTDDWMSSYRLNDWSHRSGPRDRRRVRVPLLGAVGGDHGTRPRGRRRHHGGVGLLTSRIGERPPVAIVGGP